MANGDFRPYWAGSGPRSALLLLASASGTESVRVADEDLELCQIAAPCDVHLAIVQVGPSVGVRPDRHVQGEGVRSAGQIEPGINKPAVPGPAEVVISSIDQILYRHAVNPPTQTQSQPLLGEDGVREAGSHRVRVRYREMIGYRTRGGVAGQPNPLSDGDVSAHPGVQ